MRHVFKSTLIAAALFAGSLTPAFAAPETYALEATHTEVVFSWTHFGFSKPTAKFMNAVGTLVLDEAAPANSSVEVSFAIDGLNTGVAALDEHLKKPDFFDAAKYPTATFKSTKVDVTGKDTANVTGNLTIHGVTKPVTLAVKLNKIGANMKGVKTAGFSATGQIKRSDFGMGAYVPAVSDEIDLVITAEANKK
ncbi:MAG: YceI family protein [Asticcacaulis sp.]|jgi:polyisoprenoid-binding protein YceI|uniref:YceI family protein n=1 Tax=Asticcacaulis sp. TaxID=1872648 RepID=UPI0025C22C23|nr:YceI family protein [Asticcacaulis sp.]MCA1935265.1 YceI family protein [Asticcacaulis sp.]